MYYSIVSFFVIAISILLILIVLVQNSKGGGLASNFSSSNQIMGVRKTTDFLEKSTWTLAAALLVASLVSTAVLPKEEMAQRSELDKVIENVEVPQAAPAFPAPATDDSAAEAEATPAE